MQKKHKDAPLRKHGLLTGIRLTLMYAFLLKEKKIAQLESRKEF